MAYINSEVYGSGINNTILEANTKVFIGLLNEDNRLLAFSELRQGSGTTAANDEQTNVDTNGTLSKFGTYSNSVLNINKISYSRTASKVAANGGLNADETQATQFAIIKYTGTATEVTAYEGSVFAGPALSNDVVFNENGSVVSNCTILVKGSLSSPVTINASSNFMFAGATITFSAQDVQ